MRQLIVLSKGQDTDWGYLLSCDMQPDSIRVMGDKATARKTMKQAGVPTVPGSEGLIEVNEWFYWTLLCDFLCEL